MIFQFLFRKNFCFQDIWIKMDILNFNKWSDF